MAFDVTTIPKLAQETRQALKDTIIDLRTMWEQRGLQWAVKEVSDLFFWPGDMRLTLQKIADGRGVKSDVSKLKEQLDSSEREVSRILSALKNGWEKLKERPGGMDIANEIGEVIWNPVGKSDIRWRIDELTKLDPESPGAIEHAKQLCSDIDNFNRRLIELHKRVLKPAAEIYKKSG